MQSTIVEDLIVEALEEGGESKKYNKYTTDGRLNFDKSLNEEGKGIVPISSEIEHQGNYSIVCRRARYCETVGYGSTVWDGYLF